MEIALTAREMRGKKIPMAGVPFHAIDRYLSRLLAAGHKAALAEQMEDPRFAKGLVKRDVRRIMTPGTVFSVCSRESPSVREKSLVLSTPTERPWDI